MIEQGFSETLAERFWQKVSIPANAQDCWIWKGHVNGIGYGELNAKGTGKNVGSHRASWMLHFGEIPKGQCVCHNCPTGDNRACVNPSHLWLGTKSENTLDMWSKGRGLAPYNPERGEQRYNHKLTEKLVTIAKKRCALGEHQRSVAARLGVSQTTIWRAVRGLTWKHVKDTPFRDKEGLEPQ